MPNIVDTSHREPLGGLGERTQNWSLGRRSVVNVFQLVDRSLLLTNTTRTAEYLGELASRTKFVSEKDRNSRNCSIKYLDASCACDKR